MNKTLRILMVHQGAELYGSDRSFASAVQALRQRHPTATIDVVLPEPGPLVELIRHDATSCSFNSRGILRKVELKARPWSTIASLFEGWKSYRRMCRSYDICYVNTVVCVAAIAALRGQRAKTYVHVREIPSAAASRVFRVLLRFSQAALIYNSRATAAAFGLPGAVIYNGVSAPTQAQPLNFTHGRMPRLAILGRINSWKGQQFVLNALRTHGRTIPVHVRIVGDVFPGYESLLHELQIAANACEQPVEIQRFTDEPAEQFAWADFLLVPSTLPEPFGRVAIESFAAGRPVIAAGAGGLQEIVTHGVTGFLFVPGDAADFLRVLQLALATTTEQYRTMVDASRDAYQRRFTVSSYMHAIADLVVASENTLIA